MTAYIGVVGPDTYPGQAMLSIGNLIRRPGDSEVHFSFATKGYEARQSHLDNFKKSTHDELILLDHDMEFARDTLERLRSHDYPFVSGYYMRRRIKPIVPVWFEPYNGLWPMMPFLNVPERGRLHPIGASGWGCMYMRRDVIAAVQTLTGHEQEIFEGYLNKHPGTGEPLFTNWTRPVGSDVRFPILALLAGYQLMGDPDVRPGHYITYALSPDDYETLPAAAREQGAELIKGEVYKLRGKRLTEEASQ